MNILYELGIYSPILLIIFSFNLLWNKNLLFFYYTIGVFLNSLLNIILKGIIQEPRPLLDSKNLSIMKLHKKEYLFQNGIPFDIYGMPSGHAQSAFFSTIFIYLSFKKINYIYIILTLITCYNRIAYNYHSISQVIVGSFIGLSFGYFIYNLARDKIKGKIREKPDDDGPL
jgi:membrane-associated phospholipid phosphatase